MSAQQREEIQQAFDEARLQAKSLLQLLAMGDERRPLLLAQWEPGHLERAAWKLELISTTIRTELQRRGFGEPTDTA